MLKRLAAITLSLTVLFVLAACQEKDSEDQSLAIAVVNTETIYRDSEAAKDAIAHIEKIGVDLQSELLVLQEEAMKLKDEEKSQEFFETGMADLQQRFAAAQQLVTNKVTDLFESSLENSRKKAGARVVLSADMILSKDETIDLTNDVIELMNQSKLDFASAPEDPAEKAEADTADAAKETAKADENSNEAKNLNATESISNSTLKDAEEESPKATNSTE